MSYIPLITLDLNCEQGEFGKQIIDGQDHFVYTQIMKVSNIKVDEERLKQALNFDREQYYKGYQEGYNARDKEITRCKDCKYWEFNKYIGKMQCFHKCGLDFTHETDFCSKAERKDENEEK